MHDLRDGRRLQWVKLYGTRMIIANHSDIGNYWTAVVYFKARNGTYKRVPQRAQQGIEKTNGGMVIDTLPPCSAMSLNPCSRWYTT